MKKHIRFAILLCLSGAVLATGCGKNKEQAESIAPEQQEVSSEVSEEKIVQEPAEEKETHENQVKSFLTGEWIDQEVAKQRPFACMIGNTKDAQPQYGVGQADVVYEVPVEGSITRLMGIFQDYRNIERIESIRSCRLYFAYFAKEFDAIYAHWGQAHYATNFLKTMDDLDGEDGDLGATFHRDPNRKSPHNGYTTGEGVAAGIAAKGFEVNHADGYEGHYHFNTDDENQIQLEGADAAVICPGYKVNRPWFVYDAESGLYQRFQFGEAHMDGSTNAQVSVKNILVQYTPWHNEDDNGYLYFETVTNGTGKYITNGKVIDVTWRKDNEDSPTRYYDANNNEITMNQGKTWVCVVQDSKAEDVQIYATKEEFNGK